MPLSLSLRMVFILLSLSGYISLLLLEQQLSFVCKRPASALIAHCHFAVTAIFAVAGTAIRFRTVTALFVSISSPLVSSFSFVSSSFNADGFRLLLYLPHGYLQWPCVTIPLAGRIRSRFAFHFLTYSTSCCLVTTAA